MVINRHGNGCAIDVLHHNADLGIYVLRHVLRDTGGSYRGKEDAGVAQRNTD